MTQTFRDGTLEACLLRSATPFADRYASDHIRSLKSARSQRPFAVTVDLGNPLVATLLTAE